MTTIITPAYELPCSECPVPADPDPACPPEIVCGMCGRVFVLHVHCWYVETGTG